MVLGLRGCVFVGLRGCRSVGLRFVCLGFVGLWVWGAGRSRGCGFMGVWVCVCLRDCVVLCSLVC